MLRARQFADLTEHHLMIEILQRSGGAGEGANEFTFNAGELTATPEVAFDFRAPSDRRNERPHWPCAAVWATWSAVSSRRRS